MRVLLISTNRHDRFAGGLAIRPIPLGLAILLGALRASRHEIHVLDLMFAGEPHRAIRQAVRKCSPQVIGISVRNLDATGGRRVPARRVRSFLPEIQDCIRTCRRASEARIVLGGPAVSLLPRDAFALLEPDFIVAGNGSLTFLEFLDRLERGEDWQDLPGLVFRTQREIRVNPLAPWESPPVAPCYDAFDLRKYEAAGYGIAVLTKTWPYIRTEGPTLQPGGLFLQPAGPIPMSAMPGPIPRPIPTLLEDLLDLKTRFGIRKVFLADSGFNVPLPEAKALCRALRDAGLGLKWATGLQPGSMDGELARLMREAGCGMTLLPGIGPIQEPVTDFDRHLTEFAATAEQLRAAGVPLVATVIFGRPGETRETVGRTLTLLERIDPAHVQLSVGVRVLPFTPLAEHVKAKGVIRQDGDCLHPVIYVSPEVKGWLCRHLRAASRNRPAWHMV